MRAPVARGARAVVAEYAFFFAGVVEARAGVFFAVVCFAVVVCADTTGVNANAAAARASDTAIFVTRFGFAIEKLGDCNATISNKQ